MEIHVYNRFNPPECPLNVIEGEDMFVPDQALTVKEIIQRAARGALADSYIHNTEMPDDVADYYPDLTDMIVPDESDEPS